MTATLTSASSLSKTRPQNFDASQPQQPVPLHAAHVHFVGIGGSGMSGLARMIRQTGATCTGSDASHSPTLEALRNEGFAISHEQTAQAMPEHLDLVVISAAISDDHPEVREARRRGVRVIKYAAMLGQLMLGRIGIAIAGTHGKSSTTSMTSHILIHAGLDPSFIVGATCQQIGGGSRTGRGWNTHHTTHPNSATTSSTDPGILVAEACEYDRSFHNFHPTLAVILNVEEDHLDTYSSFDAIVESFHHFASLLPHEDQQGYLLIQHELPQRLAVTAGLDSRIETLGFAPQADWQVQVQYESNSPASTHRQRLPWVKLHHHGKLLAQWRSPLPGEHMAYNAAAAAILAHQVGASWSQITSALECFAGLDRRMQYLGERTIPSGSVIVVDDYGHHPTEVDTTLRALKRHYQPKRLIVIFQPHQHSRTRFLMEEFAASFSAADLVIVPHIFFSRDSEEERRAVNATDLVDRLLQRKLQAMHLYPFDAIVKQLEHIAQAGDLIVTMGAGDVWKVAKAYLRHW